MHTSSSLLRSLIAAHETHAAASRAESLAWVDTAADMGRRAVAASYAVCEASYAFDHALAAAKSHVTGVEFAAFAPTEERFGDEA